MIREHLKKMKKDISKEVFCSSADFNFDDE